MWISKKKFIDNRAKAVALEETLADKQIEAIIQKAEEEGKL